MSTLLGAPQAPAGETPESRPAPDPAAELLAAARWVDAWYVDPQSWPPLMARLARLRAAVVACDDR